MDLIRLHIKSTGKLDEEQAERLRIIAGRCPVHRTLMATPEITEEFIEDNTSRRSGNHLMSPDVVPGILMVNRKLSSDGHDLTDVTATVLSHYGIQPLAGMTGESMF